MVHTAKILPFKRKSNIYRDRFLEPFSKIGLNWYPYYIGEFDGRDTDHIEYLAKLSFDDLRIYYHLNKSNKIISNYVKGLGLL